MPNKNTWEENNKRYNEIKEAAEMKGDGKYYFPSNDCRGFQMRMILRTLTEKHCKEKGHVEGGYEYCPLLIRYSLHNVLLVILMIMHSQNVLSF